MNTTTAISRAREVPCAWCGSAAFRTWDVAGGGGLTPRLLPSSFLEGGGFTLRACLDCGHVDWFVAADSLEALRG